MISQSIERDERTVSIENASFRWSYLFLSFGLLLSTAYRGFVRHEQAWDLLALVILGGFVTALYQGQKRVLTQRWLVLSLAAVVVALILGAILVATLS
jgi:hypothetical protein